jgi:molybdopterin-guanine dinucleotide biosynthesis protein A
LAQRAAEALAPLCSEVWISVGDAASNPVPDYRAVADGPPLGRGPLAGIDAAFEETGQADLLVLACDYPRVESALLEHVVQLAGAEDEIVLVRDGADRIHPLVALWRPAIRAGLRRALEQERYRVTRLVEGARARFLGPESFPGIDLDRALVNLNRAEDLERLESEN